MCEGNLTITLTLTKNMQEDVCISSHFVNETNTIENIWKKEKQTDPLKHHITESLTTD